MARANYYFFKATTLLMVAVLAACVLVVLAVGVAAKPAEAAFPGENGKIAFHSDRTEGEGVDNPEGDSEIFAVDPDGTNLVQLTKNNVSDKDPVYSSDGERLAFSRETEPDESSYPRHEIYVMDVPDGSAPEEAMRVTEGFSPTWSPNGEKLSFSRYDGYIYTINLTDSSEFRLTEGGSPAWSPDGTTIAYVLYTQPPDCTCAKADIYTINAEDGSGQKLLTDSGYEEAARYPTWSPDGSKIAFADGFRKGAPNRIAVINATDGTEETTIVENGSYRGYLYSPTFSPDGTKLAFVAYDYSNGSPTHNVFVASAQDGSGEYNLTGTQPVSDEGSPNWQPLPKAVPPPTPPPAPPVTPPAPGPPPVVTPPVETPPSVEEPKKCKDKKTKKAKKECRKERADRSS